MFKLSVSRIEFPLPTTHAYGYKKNTLLHVNEYLFYLRKTPCLRLLKRIKYKTVLISKCEIGSFILNIIQIN